MAIRLFSQRVVPVQEGNWDEKAKMIAFSSPYLYTCCLKEIN